MRHRKLDALYPSPYVMRLRLGRAGLSVVPRSSCLPESSPRLSAPARPRSRGRLCSSVYRKDLPSGGRATRADPPSAGGAFSPVSGRCFYLNSSGRLKLKALFFPLAGNTDRYIVPNRSWTWYELDHRLIDRFGSHRMITARQDIPLGWEFCDDIVSVVSVLSDWQWYIVQNRPGF